MSTTHATLSVSAAIVVLAGCVLIAVGSMSRDDFDLLTLVGALVALYALFLWHQETRAASVRSGAEWLASTAEAARESPDPSDAK